MSHPVARHLLPYQLQIRNTCDSAWRSRFYYYAMIATVRDQHTALPYPDTLYPPHLRVAYRVAG